MAPEHSFEKQMGCMAGFLHIFDRNHTLSGKRFYTAKRIPSSPVDDTSSESEKSSPAKEFMGQSPAYLPISEHKEGSRSSWKLTKDSPRLSLDSRAVTDVKGGLHPREIRTSSSSLSLANRENTDADSDGSLKNRSPSVVARLMGLDQLPSPDSVKKLELRRSASELSVSPDLFRSRCVAEASTGSSQKHPAQSRSSLNSNENGDCSDQKKHFMKSSGSFGSPPPPQEHSEEQILSFHEVIENGMTIKGINQRKHDLETLKQILESLQLKELLHSSNSSEQNNFSHWNFVYDQISSLPPRPNDRKMPNKLLGESRNSKMAGEVSPARSSGHEKSIKTLGQTSVAKPTQRRTNESTKNQRNSLLRFPKLNPRIPGSDSSKNISVSAASEDESSSISGSTDSEIHRSKNREHKEFIEGKNLSEITAADQQPSPISVLDSSFYKDESLTPSTSQ